MRQFLLPLFCAALLCPLTAQAQRIDQLPAARASKAFESAAPKSIMTEEVAPQPQVLSNGIVAVVNESVVSTSDLRARMALALLSSGLPNTPDLQKKLLPQVLRSLIDEQLQLQEGKKYGISISQEATQNAMKKLAEDNNIPGGDMRAFLAEHGIPGSTLETQIKATLTWNDILMRDIRPRVDVGDDEIEAFVQRLRANEGKEEYLISEIFLSVDKPEDDEAVRGLAEKLAEQIKEGAVFGNLARQFSQGLGASTGGDMGWIQTGQLGQELDDTLKTMERGGISAPVRSASGYHILGLREKRVITAIKTKEAKVKLQQAFRPFAANTSKEALLKEAATIKQGFASCEGLEDKLFREHPLWRWQDLGEVRMDEAPAWLVDKVSQLSVGEASDAMATNRGALILFVCGRDAPDAINRDSIRSVIGTEKMELLARRLQRDLRRDAYIDIRL